MSSSCCPPAKKAKASGGCCSGGSQEQETKASACCASAADQTSNGRLKDDASVLDSVKEYYGKVLESTSSLKTNACTTCTTPLYLREALKSVPEEVIAKYYGCGSPFPPLLEGLHALDLGCGSGRDCYVLAKFVGEKGRVTGIDMTREQLAVAQRNAEPFAHDRLGYSKSNMTFLEGYIEDLIGAGVEPDSVDLVVSNCVVNLSPNKLAVLEGVYKVLRHGGEFFFSDVYSDRRLSEEAKTHPVLVGECLGGALYERDFVQLCRRVGFADPRCVSRSPIEVHDPSVQQLLGNTKFESVTYRLFKIKGLEETQEDYGQAVRYKGSIATQEHAFEFDDSVKLQAHCVTPVSGNVFRTLSASRFAPHFDFMGDVADTRHFGPFCA